MGQQLEIALDDRKMNHPKIVKCQLLIPRRQRAAFLQPSDTALDHIPVTIARRVITDWSSYSPLFACATGWYHRTNAMRAQPVAYPLGLVGSVSTNAAWSATPSTVGTLNLDTIEQRLKLGRLMRLTW
jgi:hypothetical protein